MIKEFKEFISRGNIVDLAVAVIIGAAFASVVKSFSEDIIGGLIGAIVGKPDFSKAFIVEIGQGQVKFGSLLTVVINFLIVAFALYMVVKALNSAQNLRRREEAAEAAEATEAELLAEIRDLLKAQAAN